MHIRLSQPCHTQSKKKWTRRSSTRRWVNVPSRAQTCSQEARFMTWKTLKYPIKSAPSTTSTKIQSLRVGTTKNNVTENGLTAWTTLHASIGLCLSTVSWKMLISMVRMLVLGSKTYRLTRDLAWTRTTSAATTHSRVAVNLCNKFPKNSSNQHRCRKRTLSPTARRRVKNLRKSELYG